MLFGNSESPHQCNALIKHLFRNDLAGINYASCEPSSSVLHELRANQESNRFLSPNLFFGLAHNLVFYSKMLLLSMHCIAYAFGKHGYTIVHSHENSVPLLYLS
jgi:hypothetical protein